MRDCLAEILAQIEDWEEEGGRTWPEGWPAPADWQNSVPEEADAPADPWGASAGTDRLRRVYIDEILQENRLEIAENRRRDGREPYPPPARDQEPAPERMGAQEQTAVSLPQDRLAAPQRDTGDGTKEVPPLLEQLQKRRQAAEYSRRGNAPGGTGFAQPLEKRRERTVWPEEGAAREQDTAQMVDRAFRRDARRYDGGFTLF